MVEAPPPREKRKASWRAKLLLLACTLLFTLLLGEGFMRVRQYMKFGTTGPTVTALQRDPELGLHIAIPGYESSRMRIDSRGLRNPELEVPKPDGRLRIAFLGGSTTFCAEVSSNEKTWPEQVVAHLRARHPELDVDFLNAAVPGYGLRHTRQRFDRQVAALDPDVVVIYHATNDLSGDTRALAAETGLWRGKVDEPSWLAHYSVLWNWIEKNVRVAVRAQGAASGRGKLKIDPATIAHDFEARLRELVRDVQERGALPILLTFSIQLRNDHGEERRLEAANTSLYYMPYMSIEGLLAGFEAYNDAIRRTARTSGVPLLDVAAGIPGTREMFNDSVHLTEAGCAAMAELVADGLLQSPAFRDAAGLTGD